MTEALHVKSALNIVTAGDGRCDEHMVNVLKESVTKAESEAIVKALEISKGNKVRAAQLPGIHRMGVSCR